MASESSAQDVPEWYRCDDCHEYGVALWRPRNSDASTFWLAKRPISESMIIIAMRSVSFLISTY
jgi:hypothetical protein